MAGILSLLALVSAVVAYAVRALLTQRRRREMIRKHCCEPIVKYPSVEPFGRDYDRIVKQSFQDGTVNATAMALYEKTGSSTYEIHAVHDNVVNTMEPLNHQALATNTNDWIRHVRRAAFPWSRDNILTQEGRIWRKTRNMVDPLFARAELRDIEYFRKFVDRFIQRIPRDGSTVDLQPLIRKMFLDSATEFVFGESIDSLGDTSGESDRFVATFNRAQSGAQRRALPTGLRLLFNNIFSTYDKEWLADCKTIHDYVDGCVARHRIQAREESPRDKKRYVLIEGMSEEIADPVALRFQLLAIFSVGRETSATAFTNLMFMLARNPQVWEELREEALNLELSPEISYEQLHSLPSFRHTVLEALRLHTPATRIRRVAARDCILPRGGGPDGSAPCFISKGTTIWGDRFPKSRDSAIWGNDVEEFRPSRFEGKRLGWEFQPFSSGPRACPAKQQVIHQCMYLLVRLVLAFDGIENRDPCWEFVEKVGSTFESRNGCKVSFVAF